MYMAMYSDYVRFQPISISLYALFRSSALHSIYSSRIRSHMWYYRVTILVDLVQKLQFNIIFHAIPFVVSHASKTHHLKMSNLGNYQRT